MAVEVVVEAAVEVVEVGFNFSCFDFIGRQAGFLAPK